MTDEHITTADVLALYEKQEGRCAITGIKMTWGANGACKKIPTSISIDRINPKGGYTVENIRLICDAVNSFRMSMSDEELLTMAKAVVDGLTRNKELK